MYPWHSDEGLEPQALALTDNVGTLLLFEPAWVKKKRLKGNSRLWTIRRRSKQKLERTVEFPKMMPIFYSVC